MNSYIPYRTTINNGDIIRVTDGGVNDALSSMINFTWRTWDKQNGYSPQDYQNGNVYSVQTGALARLTGIQKLTPPMDRTSNVPKGKL